MVANAFVLCKVRHSVSLSPCHAMEPRVGIEQNLTEQLMRYSEPLQGVVLSFSNVKLDRPHGVIVNEMPFIHCKVLADALLFRPKEGMKLRGIVNKIGSNHVGMLFAGVFNGSVAEAELPKGYVHNYAQDCWLGEDGSSISVEDEVEVKVLRVHVAGAMVAIEATMRFDGANVVKATSTTKPKKSTHLNLAAEEPEEPKVTPVKEKKAKKSMKPVKEKKSKKSKKVVEADANDIKTASSKKKKILNLSADEPVKEKKSKKTKTAVEADANDAKTAPSKKKKVLNLSADEPVKEKKSKKTKTAVEAEKVVEKKDKKEKTIKKRKHETPAEEVAEEVVSSVEPKKHKHKDKDAKKKKHKKSKHE
ncbi:DNA-directed RNA polymerase I subunit RPA43 [Phytophthora citrophthora]|uniref:DNA-directed RNA polymerase I subunit RPA43 n=1 Tax=Phytophthora citrophthora TaxID=4793 RepID=A0AAD9GRW8_9STRA|nr:DNA-directed RNA polymerase I subunit RPA43 [Phytophthora citrophthora]